MRIAAIATSLIALGLVAACQGAGTESTVLDDRAAGLEPDWIPEQPGPINGLPQVVGFDCSSHDTFYPKLEMKIVKGQTEPGDQGSIPVLVSVHAQKTPDAPIKHFADIPAKGIKLSYDGLDLIDAKDNRIKAAMVFYALPADPNFPIMPGPSYRGSIELADQSLVDLNRGRKERAIGCEVRFEKDEPDTPKLTDEMIVDATMYKPFADQPFYKLRNVTRGRLENDGWKSDKQNVYVDRIGLGINQPENQVVTVIMEYHKLTHNIDYYYSIEMKARVSLDGDQAKVDEVITFNLNKSPYYMIQPQPAPQ